MADARIAVEFKGLGVVEAVLSDKVNPDTYRRVLKSLPFSSKANTWGKEVYFETPVTASLENGKKKVEVGDIGYWPPGMAMCLFFGPTPVSTGNEPEAASPVNVIGRIAKNIEILSRVFDGAEIRVRLC